MIILVQLSQGDWITPETRLLSKDGVLELRLSVKTGLMQVQTAKHQVEVFNLNETFEADNFCRFQVMQDRLVVFK